MFCNVADVRVLRVGWSSAGNCARATRKLRMSWSLCGGATRGDVVERGEPRVSRPTCGCCAQEAADVTVRGAVR